MDRFSRRDFVFLSSGAVAGNMLVGGLAEADDADLRGLDFSNSGLVTGNPKPLKHAAIPGFLSAEQIAPHHKAHYGGALKRAVNSKGNSVVLHEMYFDGLAPKSPDPRADVRKAIEHRFGSIENWASDFIASGKEAAGWAMLVKHPANGKLYNVVSDEHAMGVLWMARPLVVIDTYEHAFYIDYQHRKAEYVEKFIDYVDWAEVNSRFGSQS